MSDTPKVQTLKDTPRTDEVWKNCVADDSRIPLRQLAAEFERRLISANEILTAKSRELNAANERIKQLEADAHKSTQKIQRLEGWNTQNCADKVNLIEMIRDREGRIKQLEEEIRVWDENCGPNR
jgi:hypothetical protein